MSDLYTRRVLNDPEVRLSYGDPLIPILQSDDVQLELSSDDGDFDALDLLGEQITYSRFDKLSNETWAELTGKVTSQELLLDRVVLRCATFDLDALQTLLPKEVVTSATFPLAHTQLGLGAPIPVVFGNAASTNKVTDAWEMAYVGENVGSNQYDYLVGRGTFSNLTVYRDSIGDTRFIVPSGEYSVNTSAYSGFTVIRFALRQSNHGGGMHRLFVAADGMATERNFARAIQSLLSNSTWGLGLGVNTASFDTAAAALDAIGGLYCDGVMDVQRTAYDWLTQLVNVRGIRLEQNADGEYTATVDSAATALKGRFGHGIGQSRGGVAANGFHGLSTTPVSQAIKTLILDYRKDRHSGQYALATSSRNVLAVGAEKRVGHDFIRDRTTADKTACYWANRYLYERERLTFTADQMARKLRPSELISYESIAPSFSKTFRVLSVNRGLTASKIVAVGWSSAIYTYSAGTLPSEPALLTETDYTRQTPTVVSSVSIASSGTESDGQGGYAAYVVLQYTVPAETWAHTIIRRRRNGATNWEIAGGPDTVTGAAKQTKITNLIAGLSYDYQISRVNTINPTLATDYALTNQTAPTDTSAPSAPSAIAVRQGGGKAVEIDLTFTAPNDWNTTILYRNTTNNSGTAVEIERGQKKRFHDQNISYGSTYYYWAKVADYSGNLSGFSPSSSHSVTVAQIVTADVGADQIIRRISISASDTVQMSSSTIADMPDMSRTLTTTGEPLLIIFSGDAEVVNDDAATQKVIVLYSLYEDGVEINVGRLSGYGVPSGDSLKGELILTDIVVPEAGSHTYKIRWKLQSTSPPSTFKISNRRLKVLPLVNAS